MNVWQLFATALAVIVPIASIARFARSSRSSVVVGLVQAMVIPEAAFVWYAFLPGPNPSLYLLVPVALVLYGGAIAAIFWSMFQRRSLRRPTITLDVLDRQFAAAFVARVALVLLTSGLAFAFEPWMGALNLAANLIWIAAWIPARWRTTVIRTTNEIAVEPQRVFEFVSNTDNWPRYRDDFIRAEPAGAVGVGTEIVTRLPVNWLSEPDPTLAKFVEVRSVVTSVSAGKKLTLAAVGRPHQTSSSEVAAVPRGTRITSVAEGALSFPQAALGFRLELERLLSGRRAEMEKVAANLRRTLESEASQ